MEKTTKILNKIENPTQLKNLSIKELELLAQDIREGILNRVNLVGGHLGPDLGIVEATIAMHYVFNSPKDKIIFDVSHQCYPHKMITGRKAGFLDPLNNYEISGYTCPDESNHDHFVVGHTSTSVSLATGVAKARDLNEENYNVIALIGDGSLSGGEAFEGFNNATELKSNFIVIVNDNEMSIAENHGGLYANLQKLRETNGAYENNFFKTLGFDYTYIEEGNDIEKLIKKFSEIKDIDHPIVVHIHTLKGKGFEPAVKNKEWGHWSLPNLLEEKSSTDTIPEKSYNSITVDYLLKKKESTKNLVVVNAATPNVFSFTPEFRKEMGKNYTDVGIAEEHAMAYVSALAKTGAKPVLEIMSSFVQRTYDQISQDIALNNSPVTVLVYAGGISNMDMTHLGVFDIPLISNIPNIVYLAPTNEEEYLKMLDWSIEQTEKSVFIRVPMYKVVSKGIEDKTDYSVLNRYETVQKGEKIAILGLGNFYFLGEKAADLLKSKGINPTLINPKFISGIDEELLESLKSNHELVITLEDGVLDGGFGEKISRYYSSSDMKVLNFGAKKEFTDRIPTKNLYEKYNLTPNSIVEKCLNLIDTK